MNILISILMFILGFVFRDLLTYLYNINKKIKEAEEIIKQDQERKDFKSKHDLSISDNED